MSDLTPANENPWYVLMTLYGEQDGDEVDRDLHDKNRAAWNAWMGQGMSSADRMTAADLDGFELSDVWVSSDRLDNIRARFSQVWAERNSETPDPGPPNPEEMADLSKTSFEHKVVLSEMLIDRVRFTGSTFHESVSFWRSVFLGKALFNSVTFSGDAIFKRATFDGTVWFERARFNGIVTFKSATFYGTARFYLAAFHGPTHFIVATFDGSARFRSATFYDDVSFDSASFQDFAYFVKTRFGALEASTTCMPSFVDSQFDRPTSFREAVFHDCYPDFSGAVLHELTQFTAKPQNWPVRTAQDPEDAKIACAAIRHALAQQSLPEEEHFFFRREMKFARQIGGFWQRLPYRLFGVFSNYGHSIAQPLLWLIILWFAGGLAYAPHFGGIALLQTDPVRLIEPFSFSLASQFQFLGFQRIYFGPEYVQALPIWIQGLAGVQTISGVMLLFLLGLGLRARFRLR